MRSARSRVGLVVWVVVFAAFVLLAYLATLQPSPAEGPLYAVLSLFALFGVFGAIWMAYDALRYEQRPWKFVIAALAVMFIFVWYYFDRSRWRSAESRVPLATRSRRRT